MQQGSVLQYVNIDDELFYLLWKYSICYSILPSIYVECVDTLKYLDLHIDYKCSMLPAYVRRCLLPSYNYLIGYITEILYLYKGINY